MSVVLESSKQDYSSTYFRQELQSAEEALAALQQRKANVTNRSSNSATTDLPLEARLGRLSAETEDLLLLQDVTKWSQQRRDDNEATDDDYDDDLFVQADECNRLAHLLQDRTNVASSLFRTVYEREYLPLYEYLSAMLLRQVRQTLQRIGYPKTCTTTLWKQLQQQNDQDIVGPLLKAWERLQQVHRSTVLHVEGSPPVATLSPLVTELLRPLVTRVHFHFLQSDPSRPTSTRLDRLVEWLVRYLQEHFFQPHGPWHVIYYGWRPDCTMDVLNEVARLVQFVVQERNLFRSDTVSSTVLCRSMEEILQFDAFLQSWKISGQSTGILSLTDSLIASDDELLEWWINLERDSALGKLSQRPEHNHTSITTEGGCKMTPQAEVFGAMIRSIRTKAALFTSQRYLQQVAGPLCMQFLEAVHQTATALRQDLLQTRGVPSHELLYENLTSWMALLNGTHWCALILQGALGRDEDEGEEGEAVVVQDELFRFGESLARLEQVLVSDLIDTVIGDTILLQRAKLANYLMQVSYLLAGQGPSSRSEFVSPDELSVDLLPTHGILSSILRACAVEDEKTPAHLQYAPQMVGQGTLQWIAHKFMEAFLDASLVTEILAVGGRVVHKDVQLLLGPVVELPREVLRLIDVTNALQDVHLASIGDALCGLAGQPPPLTVELFALDERLYEEAVSMIRAKGWVWLELGDLLSVLNRRVDLSQPMAL